MMGHVRVTRRNSESHSIVLLPKRIPKEEILGRHATTNRLLDTSTKGFNRRLSLHTLTNLGTNLGWFSLPFFAFGFMELGCVKR